LKKHWLFSEEGEKASGKAGESEKHGNTGNTLRRRERGYSECQHASTQILREGRGTLLTACEGDDCFQESEVAGFPPPRNTQEGGMGVNLDVLEEAAL